jgi:hypothetical protein
VIEAEVIPQETVTLIGISSREEADYICAVMNSVPFRFSAIAYSQTGGKSFGSPHILDNIRIPKFTSRDDTHGKLANLGHEASTRQGEDIKDVEEQLDEVAADLWGITAEELKEIQRNFAEIRGPTNPAAAETAEEAL